MQQRERANISSSHLVSEADAAAARENTASAKTNNINNAANANASTSNIDLTSTTALNDPSNSYV